MIELFAHGEIALCMLGCWLMESSIQFITFMLHVCGTGMGWHAKKRHQILVG